ncbi:hypothetical protein [Leucobacter denitrificans]|uniref:Uncharacterized protein n=1 Tax=Leucobacter denitrificans TaxID=683042 RepID=A0A7G9S434_9MICO|nr:hypothetical protein [Leucobacter denitrificans]QNN62609.1 hypothetical protein H9L06_10285 [Leucobacter denitrificans]
MNAEAARPTSDPHLAMEVSNDLRANLDAQRAVCPVHHESDGSVTGALACRGARRSDRRRDVLERGFAISGDTEQPRR